MTLSMGVMGTVFFTVAHELLHGSKMDRLLANVLLASAGYMHWAESHLAHHIKVGPDARQWLGASAWLWCGASMYSIQKDSQEMVAKLCRTDIHWRGR